MALPLTELEVVVANWRLVVAACVCVVVERVLVEAVLVVLVLELVLAEMLWLLELVVVLALVWLVVVAAADGVFVGSLIVNFSPTCKVAPKLLA